MEHTELRVIAVEINYDLCIEMLATLLTEKLQELEKTEGEIVSVLNISPPGHSTERGKLMQTMVVRIKPR